MWRKFLKLFQVHKYRKMLIVIGIVSWMIGGVINNVFKTEDTFIVAVGGLIILGFLTFCMVRSDHKKMLGELNDPPDKDA